MIAGVLIVAQLAIWVGAPDTVSACEPVTVTVGASAPGSREARIVVPDLGPFELVRSSASSRTELDAHGDIWTTTQYQYTLSADRPGRFVLAPFEARLGRDVARSRSLRIVVSADPDTGIPAIVGRARVDTTADVTFRAIAQPETVYVGQQATYQVAVFFDEDVRDRLRRNPTFFPPDMPSMLGYEIPFAKRDPPRRKVGSRCYDALVYQRAVFPLQAGRFEIPPSQLVYSLPLSPGFFSREESYQLRTDSVLVVAVDPPAPGRPDDFGGAVGEWRIEARTDTTAARVGDPVTLTVRVSGAGNVKLIPRPAVDVPWATLVPADERVQVDSGDVVSGSKEFDWILTPRQAGTLALPPIRYPYFDPATRRYALALSTPETLHIAPGALAALVHPDSARPLDIRRAWRGPLPAPLTDRGAFWLALALVPLPAVAARTGRRVRRRRATPSATRALRAALVHTAPGDAGALRRAFLAALAQRLALAPERITRPGALSRALRHAGVSADTAVRSEQLLDQLDRGAFAVGGTLPAGTRDRVLAVFRAIDRESCSRRALRGFGPLLILLCAGPLLGVRAVAAPRDIDADRFALGVAAYDHGDFARATDLFEQVTRHAPRAPDAWADFGTAAVASGDTANAVVGWERALRLEPDAGDLRDRLAAVRPASAAGLGAVPLVSDELLLLAAAALWTLGWALTLVLVFDARRWTLLGARGALVLSAVLAAAAWHVGGSLAADDLAVVAGAPSLRSVPNLAVSGGSTLLPGEVARIVDAHDRWVHVRLDGGRDGWIERSYLVSLARD